MTRGKLEVELLQKIKHVIGRTDWDKACVLQANPDVNYHFCNEILRAVFYERAGEWDVSKCERRSIFVSQASYPIKGLHYLLQALPAVLNVFPDAHIYVGGDDPTDKKEFGIIPYGCYLNNLIKELNLEAHVRFLGILPEVEMAERFLRANVFVSASSIENSSNSVCEAMLLGVPIVSSYVGGISNLLLDQSEGFLYPHDATYMLAYYICKIFEDDELAMQMSKKAVSKMQKIANRELNAACNMELYKELSVL